MDILEMFAVVVAVVGFFKAIEWVIEKITKTHDKSQKIEQTDEELAEYKLKTDKSISELQKNLDDMKKEIVQTLEEHRDEYLKEIGEVKNSVTEMSGLYQQTVAIVELKIDNLEKKQDKHNSIIERTYELEKQVSVLDNREKVSEHRLDDLEKGKA